MSNSASGELPFVSVFASLSTESGTGYPVEIFDKKEALSTTNYHLLCVRVECQNVLKDPLQAQCGHRLCKACVEIVAGRHPGEHVCDGCEEQSQYEDAVPIAVTERADKYPLSVYAMIEDKAALKQINKLICYCPRCNDRMTFIKLKAGTESTLSFGQNTEMASAVLQETPVIMTSAATGYTRDMFVKTTRFDTVWLHLLCNREACRNVLKCPVQVNCGHRYCRECVAIIENSPEDQRFCPGCVTDSMEEEDLNTTPDFQRFPFRTSEAIEDRATHKMIKKLETHCPYIGCDTHVLLYKREEHIALCQHRPVKCRMCHAEVTAAEQINHESNECPLRMVPCDFGCGCVMKAQDLPEHRADSCPSRQTVCHICHTSIPQGGETDHFTNYCTVDVCPLGCPEVVTVSLLNHLADPASQAIHLRGLIEKYHQLKLQVQQQICTPEPQHDAALTADRLLQLEGKIDVVVNRIKYFVEQVLSGENNASEVSPANVSALLCFARSFQKAESKVHELDMLLQSLSGNINLMMGFETILYDIQAKTQEFSVRIDNKMTELEASLQLREAETMEQTMRMSDLDQSADNGILVWKINRVTQELERARNGVKLSIFSPPFKSSVYGYRMCLRVYLNGDGQGKNTHMSMFFCVMRGEYDNLLPWPFKQKVAMGLCSQVSHTQHIWETFTPDPTSSSFQRPRTEMNVASGAPKFTSIENILDLSKGYVKDDTIYICAKVDGVVPNAIHDVGLNPHA